jgi:hypothetical protein
LLEIRPGDGDGEGNLSFVLCSFLLHTIQLCRNLLQIVNIYYLKKL